MRSNRWNTERRTTLPGNSLMKQQDPTLNSTDDYSSDDDGPGAFAIQKIADGEESQQEDDWDPTEPQEVIHETPWHPTEPQEVMQETSGNDRTILHADSSNANKTITNQGQEKKKKRRCLLFLVALICCGVAGALVGVLLWDKQGAADSYGEETPPSFDECENPTDPIVQCEVCSQPIRVSDAVQDMYSSLKANEELDEHLDNDTQIESCTPENMALLWLASEVAEVMVTQESVDLLYERVSSRFLLAFLYFAWDGRNWKENRNWLSSDSECDWFGVGCNENGKIESLSLPFNNIKGSLESRLGLLRDLKKLDLAANNIDGPIPLQLWDLSSLEELFLGYNQISGSLPASFGESATSLMRLSLFGNQLVGSLPSSYGLTNLKELNLSENFRLGGRIPSDWGDFGRLESLVLSHTVLSGTIPESIGNMTSLRHLISGFTPMSGSIPSTLGYLTNLVELWLKNSNIDGSIPSELGSCTQLEFLSLADNFLTGSLATELGNLSRLKIVSVSGNKDISGTVPEEYANLAFMEDFGIWTTRIMEPLPIGLCRDGGLTIYTNIKCSCCSKTEIW